MGTSIDFILRGVIPLVVGYMVVVSAIGITALVIHAYRMKKDGDEQA